MRPSQVLTRPLVPAPPGLERLRVRVAVLGFWVLMGAMETAKEVGTARLSGAARTLGDAVLVNFPWWFFWAPATVLVMALAHRFPFGRGRALRSAAVHACAAAGLTLLHLTGVGLLVWAAVTRGGDFVQSTPGAAVGGWLAAYGVMDFFVYWMVLAAGHAFLFHRRYAEAAVREAGLAARAARSEAAAAEARLDALRKELNPHFLFNALNAVAALVETGRAPAAKTMLSRLGSLLRETLEGPADPEVPLEREVELLERYLDIERIRFGDRLDARVEVDPAARRALVPPLILQPLAENAVRHGVAGTPGPGRLRVEASAEGGRLRLTVSDDGPGPGPARREGVGLRNVRERLEAMYGEAASLRLEDGAAVGDGSGRGCRATVTLPLRAGAPVPGREPPRPEPAGPRLAARG